MRRLRFQPTADAGRGPIKRPSFEIYIKLLHYRNDILDGHADLEYLICQIKSARNICNKVMHFNSGRLEEATSEDVETLESILEKVRALANQGS